MELVNTLPIPAAIKMAPTGDPDEHHVLIVAKATFCIEDGKPVLERDRPVGFLEIDEETELGVLPSDAIPRLDDDLEVFVLGQAHASGGRPTTQQTVTVAVGDVARTMCVFGDRVWEPTAGGLRATAPTPYPSMPLTWERAFGGSCDAWLDAESPLEIQHSLNACGRGFDPAPYAEGLAKELRLPDGWPQIRHERRLPNLEHVDRLVKTPHDDPEPCCWAPIPAGIGMPQLYVARKRATLLSIAGLRAHPDWFIPRPTAGARIEMLGLSPEGRTRTNLPLIRLFVDHEAIDGISQRELAPYRLFLLPEDNQLVLSFHAFFRRSPSRRPRTLRLRAEQAAWPPELRFDGSAS